MVSATKKIGRPATGVGTPIHVRVADDLLAGIDAYRAEQEAKIADPQTMSRPEALRRLAAEALIGMGLLHPPR